jgi:hypothetical protein
VPNFKCCVCGTHGGFGQAIWRCPNCSKVYCSDHANNFEQNLLDWDSETADCPHCGQEMQKVAH